ncbi:hypothetical protein J421_3666 [Gemmatirosa kalamazoonensis]|uniref:Uncharacterized protein n=1 Tax=Gemmatirosa kalamazoonensis TaxID=861299 RepID=W0RP29_9BACT|nr:hypothetical protein J421_3666 [Gemmatirosa kalamazoonensis]
MRASSAAAELLPTVSTARPLSRAYHPKYDVEHRRDVLEFLRAKGCELRPAYAALGIAYFLQQRLRRDAICGADIRALFPRREERLAGTLRNAHDILRRAAARGLVESLGSGWYTITPLGVAVVEALPDDQRVAELRGCRTVSCGMGRRRVAHADDL